MESISFKLETFEGPLDLLLYLVSKHKLNIYDIEISLLLEQYLAYIDGMDTKDYEQAADFLEMAARLIYIKTCYLLPQPEEAEELKKELQGSLIEYSVCKLAAQRLRELYAGGAVFVREPVKLPVNKQYTRLHDKQELCDAYLAIFSKVKEYKPLRANVFSPIVSRRIVSVESKIKDILHRLYTVGHFDMSTLYDGMEDRSERIAAFLAVLELTKSGRIFLNDDNTVIELRSEPREGDPPFDDLPEISVSEPEETSEPEEIPEPEETPVPEEIPEPEETIVPEDKHIKPYSVQLALTTHTVKLIEPRPEPEAVPAFAPIPAEPDEKPSEPEREQRAFNYAEADEELETLIKLAGFTEPPKAEFRANYFGKRYYWGSAPFELGERSYALAVKLRK